MDRRSFLKISLVMTGVAASFRVKQLVKALPEQASSQLKAYGSGPYGQGVYSGYQRIYLPLLTKKRGGVNGALTSSRI